MLQMQGIIGEGWGTGVSKWIFLVWGEGGVKDNFKPERNCKTLYITPSIVFLGWREMFLLVGVLTLPFDCASKAEQRCLHGPYVLICLTPYFSISTMWMLPRGGGWAQMNGTSSPCSWPPASLPSWFHHALLLSWFLMTHNRRENNPQIHFVAWKCQGVK